MPEVGRERWVYGLHALLGRRMGWPASGPIGDGRWGAPEALLCSLAG